MIKASQRLAATVLVPLLACAAAAQGLRGRTTSSSSSRINIPLETYTLPNGLTVILSQDHTTPTVAVNVWYHVGSKNELLGRTGFAHLFEHVMFTGSGHVPYGIHDKLTEGIGGSNNGTTSNDRTTYYETVPSNYLEDQFWLESDRMGFLLDTLDIAKLNAQRDVVKNEKRQRVDNQPYGRADELLNKAVYPASNPYSWSVIGSLDDLTAASEEDVKNFFRLYYAPNNAILAVVGDFDPGQAKAWILKYFGPIPRGKPITRPSVPLVSLQSETRLVYEDHVQVPRLYIRWPTVGEASEDRYALTALAAILSGPRSARLTRQLVYETQAATTVTASQATRENAGQFTLTITPRPGHTLTDLEAAADTIIATMKTDGPTDEEIQRATASLELEFVSGLQSNLGKAFTLSNGVGFHQDPGYFQTEYKQSMAVTTTEVKRVANKYLMNGRVVLSIVPIGRSQDASKPQQSVKTGEEQGGQQ